MGVPIPNEVILEILPHLEKNDLLKCRLVSQSWNGLSLKILKNPKYEHHHELTQDNIKKFLEFSNGRSEEWVLPFYLNFTRGEEDEDDVSVDFYGIPKYIQQLHSIFGKKCVSSLTLSHTYCLSMTMPSVMILIGILNQIAPSLVYLDLSRFKVWFDEEDEPRKMKKLMKKLGKTELSFSNLSRLISCPAPILFHDDDEEEKQENELHAFLIEKSKNLKELEVISPLDLSVIDKQAGSLKKLKIVEPLEHLDKFALPNLPVLNDLSLTYSTELLDHQILIEFLSSFSTTLESLAVIFEEIPTNPFPKLSQLRFLGILVSMPTRNRIRVDTEILNLNSETFPILESMGISTNVHFESTQPNSGNSIDDWSLQTVRNLGIRVMDSPFNADAMDQFGDQEDVENFSSASAKDYVDELQHLFPNVTSLTLVNESDGHEEYLNELLIAFIQSNGAPRIKNLEIEDCAKNYLGHILNGLDDPDKQPLVIIKNMSMDAELLKSIQKAFQVFSGGSELKVVNQLEFRDGTESRVMTCNSHRPTNIPLKMTGLEKIKIHTKYSTKLNDDSGQLGIEPESNKKDLFLMSLPKHLPLLRQIDISQRMFGYDKEFCKQQIVNVQNTFPDLVINTTH